MKRINVPFTNIHGEPTIQMRGFDGNLGWCHFDLNDYIDFHGEDNVFFKPLGRDFDIIVDRSDCRHPYLSITDTSTKECFYYSMDDETFGDFVRGYDEFNNEYDSDGNLLHGLGQIAD